MNYLSRHFSTSAYVLANLHLSRSFGLEVSNLLPFLVYKQETLCKEKEKEDSYFYCTHEELENQIGISAHRQRKALKLMEDLGIITSYMKGLPAKKFYHIDEQAVAFYMGQDVEDNKIAVKSLTDKPEDPLRLFVKDFNELPLKSLTKLLYSNKKNNNKYNTPEKVSGEIDTEISDSGDTALKKKTPQKEKSERQKFIERKNKRYQKLSEKLAEIISQNKNIKITPSKIKSWANDFRLLEEKEGVQFVRQKTALNWYSDHIGEKFVPVIESGGTFRDKFIKLEAAISRENEPSTSSTSHSGLGSLCGKAEKKTKPSFDTFNPYKRLNPVEGFPWAFQEEQYYKKEGTEWILQERTKIRWDENCKKSTVILLEVYNKRGNRVLQLSDPKEIKKIDRDTVNRLWNEG